MAINLFNKLLKAAITVGKLGKNKTVVNEALAENLQRGKQSEILDLFNTIEYEPSYEYKKRRNSQ